MKYLSLLFQLLCRNHVHLTRIFVSMDGGIYIVFVHVYLKSAVFLLDLRIIWSAQVPWSYQRRILGQEFIFTVNQICEQMGVSLELTFNLHPGPSFKHSFLDILSAQGFCHLTLFQHHPVVWLARHVVSLSRPRILPSPVASTSVAYLEFLQPSLTQNSWPCTTVLFWLLEAQTNLTRFWLATQIFLTMSVFPWAHPCLQSLVVVEPVQ